MNKKKNYSIIEINNNIIRNESIKLIKNFFYNIFFYNIYNILYFFYYEYLFPVKEAEYIYIDIINKYILDKNGIYLFFINGFYIFNLKKKKVKNIYYQ